MAVGQLVPLARGLGRLYGPRCHSHGIARFGTPPLPRSARGLAGTSVDHFAGTIDDPPMKKPHSVDAAGLLGSV